MPVYIEALEKPREQRIELFFREQYPQLHPLITKILAHEEFRKAAPKKLPFTDDEVHSALEELIYVCKHTELKRSPHYQKILAALILLAVMGRGNLANRSFIILFCGLKQDNNVSQYVKTIRGYLAEVEAVAHSNIRIYIPQENLQLPKQTYLPHFMRFEEEAAPYGILPKRPYTVNVACYDYEAYLSTLSAACAIGNDVVVYSPSGHCLPLDESFWNRVGKSESAGSLTIGLLEPRLAESQTIRAQIKRAAAELEEHSRCSRGQRIRIKFWSERKYEFLRFGGDAILVRDANQVEKPFMEFKRGRDSIFLGFEEAIERFLLSARDA